MTRMEIWSTVCGSLFWIHKVFFSSKSRLNRAYRMSKKSGKKLHYGVRLRTDQLKYLKSVSKPSEWIRTAVDEKRRREERESRSKWLNARFLSIANRLLLWTFCGTLEHLRLLSRVFFLIYPLSYSAHLIFQASNESLFRFPIHFTHLWCSSWASFSG